MRGPPSPSALCKPKSLSTGKLLAAKRSFGGIVGELEQFPHDRAMQSAPTTSSTQGNGSLTDQRAEHPADANGSCQFAPYYYIGTGLVVVGDPIGSGASQEQAIVGDTPNLAARLQGVAEPNIVVIAESRRNYRSARN